MESEIIKLEEELRQAMLTNDVEVLDKLIVDSLVFTTPDGNIATKEMDLAAHKAKLQSMSELELSERTIKIYDNSAVVTVKADIKGYFGEMDISGSYRYIRVWSKINSQWQIIAGSVVKII